ncbi:hypothetical protein ACJMK2_023817 [Sinanodonta woodiana]|uniref:Uncharacterized protein n=1 Tax=Sinanodonta woodiana TaxID=1069815 RepID=A0ABD3T6L1_SINWO
MSIFLIYHHEASLGSPILSVSLVFHVKNEVVLRRHAAKEADLARPSNVKPSFHFQGWIRKAGSAYLRVFKMQKHSEGHRRCNIRRQRFLLLHTPTAFFRHCQGLQITFSILPHCQGLCLL